MLCCKITENTNNNINKNCSKNKHADVNVEWFSVFNYIIVLVSGQMLKSPFKVILKTPESHPGFLCNNLKLFVL